MGAVNGTVSVPHCGTRPPEEGDYNSHMYIIAIGWLWVTLLMAATEPNLVASVLSFVFYGLLPCSLLLWLLGTPARRKRQRQAEATNDSAVSATNPTNPANEPDKGC
jgi:hypothetical protein